VVTGASGLGVNLFFEVMDKPNGSIVNTIGLNTVPELTSFTFPVELEQKNGVFTRTVGLALANAGNASANVVLTLVDGSGNPLATHSLTLASLNQTAIDLSTIAEFQTALPAGNFIGSVTVQSSAAIVGLALEDDLGPFSALPPVAGTPQ